MQNFLTKDAYQSFLNRTLQYMKDSEKLHYEALGAVFLPGLMTGAAGIAYQLMRLAYPSKVPSVLLLETLD